MVLDSIENRELYFGLSQQIKDALIFLESTDFSQAQPGKYEPSNFSFFYIIDHYDTQPKLSKDLESHKKYIDVQYIVEGAELIGYAKYVNQPVTIEYSPENDVAFYTGNATYLSLSKNDFAIFYPNDLHKPGVDNCVTQVKKVVVKIEV